MNTAAENNAAPAIGVVNRVRAKLPEMSTVMTKIANFLLDNPRAPLEMSIGDLADHAGTSPATVTRFCRLLGFAGYAPLRVSIATDLGKAAARESWTIDIGRAFGPDDSPRDVLSSLLNAHTRSLQETAAIMDLPQMQKIAHKIAVSKHVDIYGVGGSSMLASEMHARLYRIGINAHYWAEIHAGLTSAAMQSRGCVAIGISNTGHTDETIEMLGEAAHAGALTVAISNNPTSPLVEEADVGIITSVYEQFLQPDDLSAKHVQLLVLDLLYLLVAQEDFHQSTTNLALTADAVSTHRVASGNSVSARRQSNGNTI